jgi:hypothetical protein
VDSWTYMVRAVEKPSQIEKFNELGAKGWELVSVVPWTHTLTQAQWYLAYFKMKTAANDKAP